MVSGETKIVDRRRIGGSNPLRLKEAIRFMISALANMAPPIAPTYRAPSRPIGNTRMSAGASRMTPVDVSGAALAPQQAWAQMWSPDGQVAKKTTSPSGVESRKPSTPEETPDN